MTDLSLQNLPLVSSGNNVLDFRLSSERTNQLIGNTKFRTQQTAAEIAAGIMPVNTRYDPDHVGYDVRREGADPTGTADSRLALFNSNAVGSQLYIPRGTYKVASNLTITVPILFDYAAVLVPSAGVTITINAPINAGPWQIFNVAASGSSVTGFVRVPAFYTEWFGADPTGATASDAAFVNTVALVQASNGGIIEFLAGGSYTFVGGNVFSLTRPMTIRGAGNATSFSPGGTLVTHTGTNICFDFTAASGFLVAATTLQDLHVIDTGGTTAVFASFSDAYGCSTKRTTIETTGICVQLWNKTHWTEGFVSEDCDFRGYLAGFNFKRTSATGGTNSFFGFKCRNQEMVGGGNGAGFLMNSTATNQLVLYAANIDVNHNFANNGTRLFFIGGYSLFVQSTVTVGQDGTPTIDGTDNYTFFQFSPAGAADPNGGYIDVVCKFKPQDYTSVASQGSGAVLAYQNESVFSSQQSSRSAVTPYVGQPNARVHGATMLVGDPAATANKTITFGSMQPGTKYKGLLNVYATGGALINDATYEIDHYDAGLLSSVTKLAGIDSVNAKLQVHGAGTGGAAGTGLCFDVVINAATVGVSTAWTLELEMM